QPPRDQPAPGVPIDLVGMIDLCPKEQIKTSDAGEEKDPIEQKPQKRSGLRSGGFGGGYFHATVTLLDGLGALPFRRGVPGSADARAPVPGCQPGAPMYRKFSKESSEQMCRNREGGWRKSGNIGKPGRRPVRWRHSRGPLFGIESSNEPWFSEPLSPQITA